MRHYDIVEAAPNCCVCAVIESILRRHGYTMTQYDFANHAGLYVEKTRLYEVPSAITNVSETDNRTMLGVHLSENTINDFFASNGIQMNETFIRSSEISDMNFETILDAVSEEFDVMLYLDYGVLHGNADKLLYGHCVLFLGIDRKNVTYQDPGPVGTGIHRADIYDVYRAIKASVSGGISIIRRF